MLEGRTRSYTMQHPGDALEKNDCSQNDKVDKLEPTRPLVLLTRPYAIVTMARYQW
jgi:hypothetical protein